MRVGIDSHFTLINNAKTEFDIDQDRQTTRFAVKAWVGGVTIQKARLPAPESRCQGVWGQSLETLRFAWFLGRPGVSAGAT